MRPRTARSNETPRPPTLGPREVVYQNAYQQIYRMEVDFGSFRREYYVNHYGPRAAVVVTRGDEVLLCRQYRLHAQRIVLEIPGGKVESDETPRQAAIRECEEETGVRCRKVRPLVQYHLGDSIVNPTHVFYTSAFTAQRWQGHPEVEPPVWMPLMRCLEMIQVEIVDHLSILALLAYERRLRQSGNGAQRNGA